MMIFFLSAPFHFIIIRFIFMGPILIRGRKMKMSEEWGTVGAQLPQFFSLFSGDGMYSISFWLRSDLIKILMTRRWIKFPRSLFFSFLDEYLMPFEQLRADACLPSCLRAINFKHNKPELCFEKRNYRPFWIVNEKKIHWIHMNENELLQNCGYLFYHDE